MSIGIIGDGVMGWQIALLVSSMGYKVTLIGRGKLKQKLKLKTKKILKINENTENLLFSNDINDLSKKKIIIETLPEDLNTKKEIIKKLLTFEDAIICTNTSSLNLKDLIIDNKRVCALHFLNPISNFKFVELAAFEEFKKNRSTLEIFIMNINFRIYSVPVINGLLVNRILFNYLDTVNKLKKFGVSSEVCDQIFNEITLGQINSQKTIKIIGEKISQQIFENFKKDKYII